MYFFRLSGPPVYDTVRSPVPIPQTSFPTLQRKKSANVDASDCSSYSSSLDFNDTQHPPTVASETSPLSPTKQPYLDSSTISVRSTDTSKIDDYPPPPIPPRIPVIATNGTLRARDLLRIDRRSPLSVPRDEYCR